MEATTRAPFPDAVRAVLEIRPGRKGFVVFDTGEHEPIMSFESRVNVTGPVNKRVTAKLVEQLHAWQAPLKTFAKLNELRTSVVSYESR